MKEGPEVVITYFKPDALKSGCAYLGVAGVVKKIDEYNRFVVMTSGAKLPIDDIIAIEPGFPRCYHYEGGTAPNTENRAACFTVTSLYTGALPG